MPVRRGSGFGPGVSGWFPSRNRRERGPMADSRNAGTRCEEAANHTSSGRLASRRPPAAAPIRPTQQRAGAPRGAPGLLLCQEAGVSPALLVVVRKGRLIGAGGDDRGPAKAGAGRGLARDGESGGRQKRICRFRCNQRGGGGGRTAGPGARSSAAGLGGAMGATRTAPRKS